MEREPPSEPPGAPDQAQVHVNFTTTESEPTLQLPENKRQLLVPADIRRYGLSRILNSMLATSSPVPFDFLVNGAFLGSTVEEYLRDSGLSLETRLTLQYVRSLVPPVYQASFEHDDWVAAVDVLSSDPGQERILSASYDGLVRVWNPSGNLLATSPTAAHGGHATAVKAARFATPGRVVSAGADSCVRVWKYTEDDHHVSGTLKPSVALYGHTASIDSVQVNRQHGRILTASKDGAVGLWSMGKKDAPEAPTPLLPVKRRKVSSTSVTVAERGALALMAVHRGPASAAVFDGRDRTVAYSAGQDHSVRTLDLTTGREVSAVETSHPLLSLCTLSGGSALLAAGTSARHVALVDPRVGGTGSAATSVMTLRGHANMVVGLAAAPDTAHGLVSASHDGTCRVWDLRSSRPATRDEGTGSVSEAVYVIERESLRGRKRPVAGEGCKVFGVAWDALGIVSGGEDKRVQINKGVA